MRCAREYNGGNGGGELFGSYPDLLNGRRKLKQAVQGALCVEQRPEIQHNGGNGGDELFESYPDLLNGRRKLKQAVQGALCVEQRPEIL